jgi:hypothetical protein
MKFLGMDIGTKENCSVLTFSNGSSIKLIRNKTSNIRGTRRNLMSLLCTCPTCGDEYWKQFDLRYDSLPPVIDEKYMLACSKECMN